MKAIQRKWSTDETNFLKKNYTRMTDEEIAEKLDRTAGSIERKRHKLGLNKNSKKVTFTMDQEMEILHSKLTYDEIAEKYSINREQARGIFRKYDANHLYAGRSKRWTKEEDAFLRNNYLTLGDGEIAKRLNRSSMGVLRRRVKLDLTRDFHIIENPPERYWNEKDVKFLISNIDNMTYAELSDKLQRSIHAIATKASKLGLIFEGAKWSEKEDNLLMEYRNMTKQELSFLLNRSEKAIIHRATKLGVKLGDKEHKTELEVKIEKILIDLGVEFEPQAILGSEFNYRADFAINNIVIEAHGDYWHGNPLYYSNPNEMQKVSILKDKIKKEYFESLGYSVYEIWESEVNNDHSKVKDFIARLTGNC